ncbi:Uncharacterised protein [Chlamydia abortus]|nr:Uncharacterised protein [Chlamydia abortus]SGA32522.1 Uncharacterised protein [Chlamydia abortus]
MIKEVVENASNNEMNFQKLLIAVEIIYLNLIVERLKIDIIFCEKFPIDTSTRPLISSVGFFLTENQVIKKINKLIKTNGTIIVNNKVGSENEIILFSSVQYIENIFIVGLCNRRPVIYPNIVPIKVGIHPNAQNEIAISFVVYPCANKIPITLFLSSMYLLTIK